DMGKKNLTPKRSTSKKGGKLDYTNFSPEKMEKIKKSDPKGSLLRPPGSGARHPKRGQRCHGKRPNPVHPGGRGKPCPKAPHCRERPAAGSCRNSPCTGRYPAPPCTASPE